MIIDTSDFCSTDLIGFVLGQFGIQVLGSERGEVTLGFWNEVSKIRI